MATLEKLQKSLESLKNIAKTDQPSDSRKKDKIHLCHIITEALSNPSIKVSPSFNLILGVTLETFLTLCDDSDSDVRMTCDECLNRVIRVASETHIGKIQIELHKEIKKNGSSKSLRAALVRFAQLAHLIRPHKGKAYVTNLFPSIIKICDRSEESIHETLASSFLNIITVLGCFAPESETKVLLKAFLKNISKTSTVIRRTSTTCILNICQYSKRPYGYVSYCLDSLLDLVLPLDETLNEAIILGVLGCIKTLLPYLKDKDFKKSNIGYTKDLEIQTYPIHKLLQIYELCIIYLKNKDHNVIIAAFETLNVLLTHASEELKKHLLNDNGIEKSRITRTNALKGHVRSPSQLSVSTTVTANEDSLFSECELTETLEPDIEKWIIESKLTMLNSPMTVTSTKSFDTLTDSSDRNLEITDFSVGQIGTENILNMRKTDSTENLEKNSEHSSENSYSVALDSETVQEVDIGEFLDKTPPLLYCTRFISKTFLLQGISKKCISDKKVRVSVKSSAMSCLYSIFRVCPSIFFQYLDKNFSERLSNQSNISNQPISEIILFSDHQDPQLRAAVVSLVAEMLVTILKESHNDFKSWLNELDFSSRGLDMYTSFLEILEKSLKDENSNCLKQNLTTLNPKLNIIIVNSHCDRKVIEILEQLPLLASNPYWLVKVSLCELVSNLCYLRLFEITRSVDFQNRIFYNVLFELLRDGDQRVRSSAADAFVAIVEKLYFPNFEPKESLEILKAKRHCQTYLKGLEDKQLEYDINKRQFIKSMPFPYSKIIKDSTSSIDFSLSIVVEKLFLYVLKTSSKHFIFGCIETLSKLSNRYPPTVYEGAWNCVKPIKSDLEAPTNDIPDMLSLCVTLLTNSSHVFDVQFLDSVLTLTGNLYAGFSIARLLPVREAENLHFWNMFSNQHLKSLSEIFLGVLMKLLHIFHTVINDIVPVAPQSKINLPHLTTTNAISPIKRQKSNVEKKSPILDKSHVKEEKIVDHKNTDLGNFVGSQHFMKIYEILRSSFVNYKISLDPQASEKFINLLKSVLHCLSIILEVSSLIEFGRIAEEILLYLKSTFILDSARTVQCVQQLLKCLFGTNLASNSFDILSVDDKIAKSSNSGLYWTVFKEPYEKISECLNILKNVNNKSEFGEGDNTVMGFLRRTDMKKPSVITKVNSDKTLASYIRIFEPIVIKALKQYTITSDVKVQAQVLQLLCQLVQLRVNYCLLDSEQVFKDFVLKQFEFIEEGQIRHSEILLPKIFQFLVLLSYSKQHSKSIIEVPKIIQLCDGLMASGQCPETHCIPALRPIIEDVFLVRNKSNTSDIKELETTRDVVISMLLRLFEYKDVINLVTLILEDCKYSATSSEKWLRWSYHAFSVFSVLLRQNKIKLDDTDSFISLKKFVFSLNPEVFTSLDEVFLMLFQAPPHQEDLVEIKRWLSKVGILLIILLPLKEDGFLNSINNLKADFSPGIIFENYTPSADPLNVHNNADIFEKIPAEKIVASMILRVVALVAGTILDQEKCKSDTFLVEQFSVFLMCSISLFQAGNHLKVTKTTMDILQNKLELKNSDLSLEKINNIFLKIRRVYPTLALHWWYVLTLLEFDDFKFWKNLPYDPGVTVVLCDFLIKSPSEKTSLLFWTINDHFRDIIEWIEEPPVLNFILFIFQSLDTSKSFLNHFDISLDTNNVPFLIKIQKTLELCHVTQLGTAIKYLVNSRMLCNRNTALARNAATMVTRKLEIILTFDMDEAKRQMPQDEILKIKNELASRNLDKKYETLVSLLNKILVKFYDFNASDFKPKPNETEIIKNLQLDKTWFLDQMAFKNDDLNLKKQVATAISKLSFNEISDILVTQVDKSSSIRKFVPKLVSKCLEVGTYLAKNQYLQEEPEILKAAIERLFSDIEDVIQKERKDKESSTYIWHGERLLFNNFEFNIKITDLVHSLTSLMRCLEEIKSLNISEREFSNIFQITAVLLEFIDYDTRIIHSSLISYSKIENYLNCVEKVLSRLEFFSVFATDDNVYWLCLFVNSLHSLVEYLLRNNEPLPNVELYVLKNVIKNDLTKRAGTACHNLYVLIHWLYRIEIFNNFTNLPDFLFSKIRKIVILLGRLPQFYSYNLVPLKVWKIGWEPELSGKFLTEISALPMDYLQELDVLEEFIFRVNLLGWTSRQQFEETWMSYLSVLCYPLDNTDSPDFNNSIKASILAVKAITTLLMQTVRDPILGNKNISSKLMHASRNKEICDENISIKKLKKIQTLMEDHLKTKNVIAVGLENVFDNRNFEKISEDYSYGQLSIKYFMVATDSHVWDACAACEMYKTRRKMLEDSGIDVNSCLQFLLDYFTQLIKSESSITDLGLLHEIVKSAVILSDLFTEKTQFEWMQNTFTDLLRIHAYEDELLHQYLVVGLCKSVAVICPELEVFEQVKKTLVQFLKSAFVSASISCLYGILYLIEGCLLNNTKIGGVSEETQLLLPSIVEYLQLHLNTSNCALQRSQEHRLLVWALAFFLIENIDEVHMEAMFVDTTLLTAFEVLKSRNRFKNVEKCIIKGMERLLILRPKYILEKIGKRIYSLALDSLKSDDLMSSLMGFQLLVTYMYTDCAEHLEKDPKTQSNPDQLVQTMEKTTAIFESVKRGYTLEAELICTVLPQILDDFFSSSDILTKVIGEFLSKQQPHPKLMSGVVFKVFENAITENQLSLIQDWVVFSLANFTHSFSNMAVWSLTCFFISASKSHWLRSIFPYVQSRIGRYEPEDKNMFCIAGLDFYNNLSEPQKNTFVQNFSKAKDDPDTPFHLLLNCL